MFRSQSYLAIIPARGGSKGIPRKNIAQLAGKPLIAYTIEAALQSKYLDSVTVSTEDEEIAQISRSFGARVIMRPPEYATDEASSIDVVFHVINSMDRSYDNLVYLQPTSPLRLARHIDEAIVLFSDKQCRPLVSVSKAESHPILIRKLNSDGELENLLDVGSTVRRQDMMPYYNVNGAIYIHRISDLTLETSQNDNDIGYVMPREYSADIDEPIDLVIAEAMVKQIWGNS